jgi:signal transduction histidine kinase
MAAQMLSAEAGMPEHATELLDMIERNVLLETALVDDLLDVTRIAQGKLELSLERVDVHEILTRSLEICHSHLIKKGHKISTNLQAEHSQVMGDSTRLQQVFWNLIQNACKFTPPGGKLEVTTSNTATHVVIAFRDNGVGIRPESLPKLFDAFTQADASIARTFGGLGLGLSIAKATVCAHGGTIGVTSEGLGTGATFTVELPCS